MMPEVDGYEVCRRIRETDERLPILFLSAKNEEIDVVVGLEIGSDDFIRKPFGKHELLARIRGALRRSRNSREDEPAATFRIKDRFTVYPAQLRAGRRLPDPVEGRTRFSGPIVLPAKRAIHSNSCPGSDEERLGPTSPPRETHPFRESTLILLFFFALNRRVVDLGEFLIPELPHGEDRLGAGAFLAAKEGRLPLFPAIR